MERRGNVIILANIEWNFLKQRHQFLAENLGELGYNVIFVESAAKRNPTFKDIPRILARVAKKIRTTPSQNDVNLPDNVSVVTPLVLPSTFKLNRFINDILFVKELSKKIKMLIDRTLETTVIWYAPTSTTEQLLKYINPETVIYDCVSNFSAFSEMPDDTVLIEDRLIKMSNTLVCDCQFLFDKHSRKSNQATLIEPAVDFNHFNKPFVRKNVKAIKNIGYFGQLDPLKIDVGLLAFLAEKGLNISVIGSVKGCSLPNSVLQRESIDAKDLPAALKDFDALILPYNLNEYTKGIIPAKFFECFATGLPIIATKLYNFNKYQHLLITGSNYSEIYEAITSFSPEDDVKSSLNRLEVARSNSWESFTNKFVNVIEKGI